MQPNNVSLWVSVAITVSPDCMPWSSESLMKSKFKRGQWVTRKGYGVHYVLGWNEEGTYVLDRCDHAVPEDELELTATIGMGVFWPAEEGHTGDNLAATSEADGLAMLHEWLRTRVGQYEPIDTDRITYQHSDRLLDFQPCHVILMTYAFPEERSHESA